MTQKTGVASNKCIDSLIVNRYDKAFLLKYHRHNLNTVLFKCLNNLCRNIDFCRESLDSVSTTPTYKVKKGASPKGHSS